MKTISLLALILPACAMLQAQYPSGRELLEQMDRNMSSESRVLTSKMVVHGPRSSRTIESKTWAEGETRAFTEYLSPAREEGTKMLKQENSLWIYSPTTDRTITISGHMLRQSVMGSDLSYEDMMDDASYLDNYSADVTGEEVLRDRDCWIIDMEALSPDVSYQKRRVWMDKQRNVPLQEELYAKSGKLLKRTELEDFKRIGTRWYPGLIRFKDMLKRGDGTEFIIEDIEFNVEIPEVVFTKASLR